MRQHQGVLHLLTVLVAVLATAACTVGLAEQTTEDFRISLSADTPVRVGKQPVVVRIAPTGPDAAGNLEVLVHYYPFVHRVKDLLASADEVVRVVPARRGAEGYGATLELDRAGPWKIAVRIRQADKPDTITYFTVDAEESPGAGGS